MADATEQRREEVDERQRVGGYHVEWQTVTEAHLLTDASQQRHQTRAVGRRADEADHCQRRRRRNGRVA